MWKMTAKSCSCRACKRAKHAKRHMRKLEERAARHATKAALKTNAFDAIIAAAHCGARAG